MYITPLVQGDLVQSLINTLASITKYHCKSILVTPWVEPDSGGSKAVGNKRGTRICPSQYYHNKCQFATRNRQETFTPRPNPVGYLWAYSTLARLLMLALALTVGASSSSLFLMPGSKLRPTSGKGPACTSASRSLGTSGPARPGAGSAAGSRGPLRCWSCSQDGRGTRHLPCPA